MIAITAEINIVGENTQIYSLFRTSDELVGKALKALVLFVSY